MEGGPLNSRRHRYSMKRIQRHLRRATDRIESLQRIRGFFDREPRQRLRTTTIMKALSDRPVMFKFFESCPPAPARYLINKPCPAMTPTGIHNDTIAPTTDKA